MPLDHGRTARTFLQMRWDYPVHNFFTPERSHAYTVAHAYPTALPRQEAFYRVAEQDRRPLLVLRECYYCNGTDDALLAHPVGNERTLIMMRWFHAVKLPMDVLNKDHIFRNLFAEKHPPHVFLSTWDGKNVIPLDGDASSKEIWDGMYRLLQTEYQQDAHKAVKKIELLVAQYDMLDEKITKLEYDYEHQVETDGESSRKSKKLKTRLDNLTKHLKDLRAEEEQASHLQLKHPSAETLVQPVAGEEVLADPAALPASAD